MDFKALASFEIKLSKAVPSTFHGSSEQRKPNCLQDPAYFHRSQAYRIVIIFNTVISTITVMNQYCVFT